MVDDFPVPVLPTRRIENVLVRAASMFSSVRQIDNELC